MNVLRQENGYRAMKYVKEYPQQKIVSVVFESHMLKKIAQTATVECRS